MLSLAPPPSAVIGEQAPVALAGEPGLADVVTFGRQRPGQAPPDDEERFFADSLAEYQWARDVAGLAPSTLGRLIRPVIEVCEHYGLVPWRLTPRHVDRYFSGPGSGRGRRCHGAWPSSPKCAARHPTTPAAPAWDLPYPQQTAPATQAIAAARVRDANRLTR